MKCSACKKNLCRRKYKCRDSCIGEKEGIDCLCTCQVSGKETFITSAVSIVGGACLIAGGVALIANPVGIALFASPVGIAAAPLAGACFGGGLSMIATPFINMAYREKMTFRNFIRNFIIGAGLGAVGGALYSANALVAVENVAQAQCLAATTIGSVSAVFTAYGFASKC